MKTYILLVTLHIVIFCHWSSASSTGVEERKTIMTNLIRRRLKDIWTWLWRKGDEEGFVGRCLGAARKLKFVMPLIVFKLGVIITTLVFLTIFALKSLGLLIMLLFVNSGGLAAKLAHLKHDSYSPWSQPQNVHFHLHPKDGPSSDYGHYYDKMDYGEEDESLMMRLKRLNIYDSYRRNLL